MELQFQKPTQGQSQQQQCHYQVPTVTVAKNKAKTKCSSSKFVGVRQRPSGRWVAEIKDTTQKIRMWLGTFETAEEAARAYDEAACLLRGSNTRTNFATQAAPDSPLASRIRTLLTHKKLKKSMPQPTITFSTAVYHHARSTVPAAATSTSTSGVSPSRSNSSSLNFATNLSNFAMSGGEELQLASSQQQYDQSWALNTSLLPIGDGCDMSGSNACPVASDQDKMKAEKQGSHGMNGIQEQETFGMGNDLCDSLWDLPPICQLSCKY